MTLAASTAVRRTMRSQPNGLAGDLCMGGWFAIWFVDKMHAKSFVADRAGTPPAGNYLKVGDMGTGDTAFTCATQGERRPGVYAVGGEHGGLPEPIIRLRRSAGRVARHDCRCVGRGDELSDGTGGNEGRRRGRSGALERSECRGDGGGTMIQPDSIVLDYGDGSSYYEVNAIGSAYG